MIISRNLSWSSYYTSIVSKALNTLWLIRRTIGTSSSIQVRNLLYIILVRSQVTYCSPVWHPHQIKNILLERVQQKATKWILNDYKPDYKSRLCSLQLLPLMMLYEINDIAFFLKSVKTLCHAFDISQFVTFSSSSTHSYGCKLIHRYSCQNSSHQFYFTRLPRLWNKLSGLVDLLNCLFTVAKKQLHQLMWSSFIAHFNQDDICTFQFHCPCNKCIMA